MTTLFEIPLRDVSSTTINNLQSKYPSATLRIEVEESPDYSTMNEDKFWQIIDLLDWKTLDSDAILAPAVEALSHFSEENIHAFHDILNKKLYALDGRRFAEQVGSNRYAPEENKYFSADSFLYARCCVVGNGQVFYKKVLQNPAKMPKEYTFESLLYLPRKAWQLKTKQDNYNYFPETWNETFSNPDGWTGIMTLKDRIISML